MVPFDASKTFKNVVSIRTRLEKYGEVHEDVELYSDLYIALTVLEKLEISYSKSLLSMNEYEAELSVAVQQCTKCHTLVKSKVRTLNVVVILCSSSTNLHGLLLQFPTFRSFVEAFKDTECTFRRALVQLEGANLISKPIPSFPLSDQTTAAHLILVFERCGEIKEIVETYENDSYMLQVGRIRDLINSLMSDLDRLDGAASKVPSVDIMRQWARSIESMESRATVDSQKLLKDVSALKQGLMTIAHAYRA